MNHINIVWHDPNVNNAENKKYIEKYHIQSFSKVGDLVNHISDN